MKRFFSVHNCSILVISSDNNFIDLISHYLSAFFVSHPLDHYDITVNFGSHCTRYIKPFDKGRSRIGDGLYLGNSSLYWQNDFGFVLEYILTNESSVVINCYHHALQSPQSSEDLYRNLIRSYRWSLLLPIIHFLGVRYGVKVSHASAVNIDGNARVFAGHNKVGKSTLASHYISYADASFVCDNFFLSRKDSALLSPELLRVDSRSPIPKTFTNEKLFVAYGKNHYSHTLELTSCTYNYQYAFIMANSEDDVLLEEINPSLYNNYSDLFTCNLTEFPHAQYIAFAHLLYPPGYTFAKPLSKPKRAFMLKLPLGYDPESVIRMIEQCI